MAERELGQEDVGAHEVHLVNERSNAALIWWPVFLVTQFVAFFVVLALDPAGFDPCDPTTSAGPRPVQAVIAGVVVVGALALAVWRLRRWHLVAALVAVAFASLAWVWLLGGEPSC